MDMSNLIKPLLLGTALLLGVAPMSAKRAKLTSPNDNIIVVISDEGGLHLELNYLIMPMLNPSPIGLEIQGRKGGNKIKGVKTTGKKVDNIVSPFYRQSGFQFEYKSMTVNLDNGVSIEVRASDQGVAYRYVTNWKEKKKNPDVFVLSEKAEYNIAGDRECWIPYSTNDENPMAMAFQNVYDHTTIGHAKDKLAFLPMTVAYPMGSLDIKMTITESDLESYPGMFLRPDSVQGRLVGEFAPYPKDMAYYPWRKQLYVKNGEDYIARTKGTRTYPWRIFTVTLSDTNMPVNNMVYALASASKIKDTSWIKPGKVAWDWWNDWGLKGVPFKAGINMDTYRYYIDFASEHGIEYVILDEGWYDSKSGDMLTPIEDLDIRSLIHYANGKGVGLALWTVFNVLDSQLEEACKTYSAMGIKGFKVDFLDRDDQTAVEMTYRIADMCAKYNLMLDYHGYYKPTGINRTYPNIINFEGVFGMEEVKWTEIEKNMPEYDVTFPYIRLLAGPVDYTPGAMRNGTKHDWKAMYYNPMSMGTRCHQLAAYVVYDSPFTMLCDAPTNYIGEEDCVEFMVGTPNNIDETRILQGELGKYIVTARRKGQDWWVGGMTNWDEREIHLSLGFLSGGTYEMTLYSDGPNANKVGEDYLKTVRRVNATSKENIKMASGGGFAIKFRKL